MDYNSMTKAELVAKLENQTKKGKKPLPAFLPFNRQGVKAITLGTEAGAVGLFTEPNRAITIKNVPAKSAVDHAKEGNLHYAGAVAAQNLDPRKSTSGKVFWGSIIVGGIAKVLGKKRSGPIFWS